MIPRCCTALALMVFAQSSSLLAELPAWLDADAQQLFPDVVALRRDFHQNPELSNGEERTAKIVAERLRSLGLEVKTGVARHGVVALLRGGKPGPVVALRADMDALPIEEAVDVSFKSRQPGVMHACGHDAHTAIGLGVAQLLARRRDALPGTVKFLFQPAEEGMPVHYAEDWGALLMIREGALENPTPQAIFALHCGPHSSVIDATGNRQETAFPAGRIGYLAGAISANSDRFSIVVRGKMAHGSAPHRGVDAIQVAAAIVNELQSIRSRHIDTQEPLVLTIGTIRGGQRENILAERVEMTGTVRTHHTKVQDRVIELMNQISKGVAESHGATAEVLYRKGYPASINDPALVRRMLPTVQKVVGKENVSEGQPSMGGEDFAYFAQKVPGFYLRLGVARPGVEKPAGLHTAEFEIDESALLTGMRVMTALLWEALENPAPAEKAK
ncbi:MAG: amidohydrolase [Verrucomicrobiota bacterium]|nr:amidohydrolase [Verrucomicrobiota bacterium]